MGQDTPDQRDGTPPKAEADDKDILGVGQHHAVEEHMHPLAAQAGQGRADNRLVERLGGQVCIVEQSSEALDFTGLARFSRHRSGDRPLLGRNGLTHADEGADQRLGQNRA